MHREHQEMSCIRDAETRGILVFGSRHRSSNPRRSANIAVTRVLLNEEVYGEKMRSFTRENEVTDWFSVENQIDSQGGRMLSSIENH